MKTVLLLAALNSLTGTWIGQTVLGARPTPLRLELSTEQQKIVGKLSLPFEGLSEQPLSEIDLQGSNVRFAVETEQLRISFTGDLKENRITGEAQFAPESLKGTFEITRIVPVRNDDYFGAYKMEDGSFLFIRTWDELGEKQLTFLEEGGRVGPLFARSEQNLFTGPGLYIPLPEEGNMEFQKDASGKISGFLWTDSHGNQKKGVRTNSVFREREVRFTNGNVSLSGSLVIPQGEGPFPAIVLVHGSGPVTRDFFGPVSYLFASRGIAVLSYDKRGVGGSSGNWMTASFFDYAADAVAGVRYLRTVQDVDPERIGLWGASQAGWIIPEAVAQDQKIAFAVLLSVPGVTPYEQELQRSKEEMLANNLPTEEIDKAIAQLKEQIDSLRTGEVKKQLLEEVAKLKREGNQDALQAAGPDNPQFLLWYGGILDHSPVEAMAKMKCPVLVLYGELDRGVPVVLNRPILESAFEKAGNDRVTFHVFPKGNHALLVSETGSMSEFPYLTHFVPCLFHRMVEWVQKNSK